MPLVSNNSKKLLWSDVFTDPKVYGLIDLGTTAITGNFQLSIFLCFALLECYSRCQVPKSTQYFLLRFFCLAYFVTRAFTGLVSVCYLPTDWTRFPASCQGKSSNCCRVSLDGSRCNYGNGAHVFDLTPPHVGSAEVSIDYVKSAVQEYLIQEYNAHFYSTESRFLHALCRTTLLGFPDDIALSLSRGAFGKVIVEVQSQSRIGHDDIGANGKRVAKFIQDLEHRFSLGD